LTSTLCLVAKRLDELHDPVVVEIEDDFSRLPRTEQIRRTQEWLDSLHQEEPVDMGVTAAELLSEVRTEEE
jgi:hypothetical protein